MNIIAGVFMSIIVIFVIVATIAIACCFWYLYKELRKRDYCGWSRTIDDDPQLYNTGCGNEFHNANDDGTHVTSWAKHCVYCGGKITK